MLYRSGGCTSSLQFAGSTCVMQSLYGMQLLFGLATSVKTSKYLPGPSNKGWGVVKSLSCGSPMGCARGAANALQKTTP